MLNYLVIWDAAFNTPRHRRVIDGNERNRLFTQRRHPPVRQRQAVGPSSAGNAGQM